MAGLHELRFTEEKPLLRGQDAELVSPVTALAPAPARGVPGRGCLSSSLGGVCVCWYWVHVCARVLVFSACVCADVCWYRCTCIGEHGFWFGVMMYMCEDVAQNMLIHTWCVCTCAGSACTCVQVL